MTEWSECSWGCNDCGSGTVVEKFEDLTQTLRCPECGWKYVYSAFQQEAPRADRDGPDPPQVDSKECPKPNYAAVDVDLQVENWVIIEEAVCDACGEKRSTVNLKASVLDNSRLHICRGGCDE